MGTLETSQLENRAIAHTPTHTHMFDWITKRDTGNRRRRERSRPTSTMSVYNEESEVYNASLPPTLPVVKSTIDSLVDLAAKQRMFISSHADRLKL